jgi:hypothetical protein
MPEISRFFGIIIRMFHSDQPPPHFHAYYSGQWAVVDIDSLEVTRGHLSPRVAGLVREWASLHQAELRTEWELAREDKTLFPIAPLE